VELRIRRPGPVMALLEFTSAAVRMRDRNEICFRVAIRDVSEQRAAEEKARAAEAQFKFVANQAPVLIERCSRDRRYLFVNETWAKMMQRSPKDVVGQPIAGFLGQEAFATLEPSIKRVLRGEFVEVEISMELPRAGRRVLQSVLRPELDRRGRVTGWVAAGLDVTARKETEQLLQQARETLEERVAQRTAELRAEIRIRREAEQASRESEARLFAITDHCPVMIFLKDLQGRYLHINRQFAEVFGLKAAAALGKTDPEIFPAEQAAVFGANELKVLSAGAPIIFDEVVKQPDGPHFSVAARFPLIDSHGKIYAIGGVIADVTDRRQLEDEILRISEREQRRIAQDLHDGLGQRLAGVSFMADVLMKNLAKIQSPQLAHATRISSLLQATVAEARGLAHGLHPVDEEPHGLMCALNDLAERVSAMFKVRCCLSCPEPVLLTDNSKATHLYRIAQEAVTNAIRHGKARRVEIVLSSRKQNLMLAIRDDGVGIKHARRRRRSKDKGNGEGEGMGLRIMEHRAEMMGGSVQIIGRKPRGTEVVCTIATSNPSP
jgi:PAS domain S-box-containing protein